MKYTREEEMNEILRRSKKVLIRRERRKLQLYACMTSVCALLLVLTLAFLPDGTMMTSKNSVYG